MLTHGPVPLQLVRSTRARRYVMRLHPDGSASVSIPPGGTQAGAREFANRHKAWLERALQRQRARPQVAREWMLGGAVYFRGEELTIEAADDGRSVRFGTERVPVTDLKGDLRPAIEWHLGNLAVRELPPRVKELARTHGLQIRRIAIRAQRSRWGSCSQTGTISLNWRLIQVPPYAMDYVILHELMHLRELNHSDRFWNEVERVCPDYRLAERWLTAHSRLLI